MRFIISRLTRARVKTDGMNKTFVHEQDLLEDAIYESGYRPDFIAGLWRGGSTVGIYVQECLQYLGVATDHIAIRTSYHGRQAYFEQLQQDTPVRVHGLQYLYETLQASDSLLIVDDVLSTGKNVSAMVNKLQQKTRKNMPEVKVATVYYRPPANAALYEPDFFLRQTDDWLVLPYEITGNTREEIARNKSWLLPILDELRPGWT